MTSIPPPGQGSLWGNALNRSATRASARASPLPGADQALEPLSRRLLGLAALLSVLLLAVVANSALRSGGNPFNPIAAAAVRTQTAPGARFSMEAIYSAPQLSAPVVAHGSGAFNSHTKRSRATLEVPTPTGTEEIVSVGDQRTIYMRSASISAGLPPGRPWLGVQPWMGRSESAALAGNGSATSQLEMMRAVASEVESLGEETVRGASTHRYRGTIDLDRYAQLLEEEGKAGSAREYERLAKLMPTPLQVEVWVDGTGMARRLREVMTLPVGPSQAPVRTDMRMDFFGFGSAPKVTLPAAGEVFDSTPLVRAELNLLDGESAGRLIAPSGLPLSAAAYQRRSGAICAGIEHRIGGLRDRAAAARVRFEAFAR